jgi:hypothetical protein
MNNEYEREELRSAEGHVNSKILCGFVYKFDRDLLRSFTT